MRLKVFLCENHNRYHDQVTIKDCDACPYFAASRQEADLRNKTWLRLTNDLSPGDCLAMTAALEALHRQYPGKFATDVICSCPDIFEHNPWVTPLPLELPGVRTIKMEYPLVHDSDNRPIHFLDAYVDFLGKVLELPLVPVTNRPAIYLSPEEMSWRSQVHDLLGEALGEPKTFWVVVAGYKTDFSAKWWGVHNWQRLVDLLKDRIRFVQVGELSPGHVHPLLNGVLDLRGRTTARQLIRLIYHAEGVVCGTTFAMHLAAALQRPAVIVAGAREPQTWNTYPMQRYLSTIGAVRCGLERACWKSRTVPLHDGSEQDTKLCEQPILEMSAMKPEPVPRCLQTIKPETVAAAVLSYYDGGVLEF